jgi:hypothetical protein
LSDRYTEGLEVVEDCDTDLEFGDLTVEVARGQR